ncbi:hypothetical protein BDN67DRAFT_970753 [Paxillus ammoniavirescens]|nr:hypothetical protein BDN67DRAFT_970753 [Paxillus ammoniavirescens]
MINFASGSASHSAVSSSLQLSASIAQQDPRGRPHQDRVGDGSGRANHNSQQDRYLAHSTMAVSTGPSAVQSCPRLPAPLKTQCSMARLR